MVVYTEAGTGLLLVCESLAITTVPREATLLTYSLTHIAASPLTHHAAAGGGLSNAELHSYVRTYHALQ